MVAKAAIFRPKPWVNPFGKMSVFRVFELSVFLKKSLKNGQFCTKIMG